MNAIRPTGSMAFGSIVTLAGYLLATRAGDVTAQPEPEAHTALFSAQSADLQQVSYQNSLETPKV